jgi:acetyl esterase/lipase
MTIHHFDPPRTIFERIAGAVLRRFLQLLLKPVFSPRFSIAFQRPWMRFLSALTLPPRGVAFEPAGLAGVRGEWVRPRAPVRQSGTVLYLHGGAYSVGAPATHRAITGRLARASRAALFALDYRLAPEHPFPAALEDAISAFLALSASGPVVLAGDSAGGGLAAATAVALRDRGHAAPAGLVIFSPWVDLTLARAPARPPPGEAMLSVDWARLCAGYYLGSAAANHPWASPVLADLRGLPPALIQAGTDELLYPEALRFHDALEAAGVAVRCEITAHRWHDFQMHGGMLPSADQALERAAAFAVESLDRAPTGAMPTSPESGRTRPRAHG